MTAMQVTAEAALRYPLTFAPFTIKNVELRNRVIRTSMGSGIPAGLVNDELIAFHVARARGGVALTYIDPAQGRTGAPRRTSTTPAPRWSTACAAHGGRARRGREGLPAADARRADEHPAGRLGAVGRLGGARPRPRDGVPADDALDDRRGRRRVRDGGAARQAGRHRRHRGARRSRLPVQQLPVAGHQPPHRRVRRPVREPRPAAVRGARGHPGRRSGRTTRSASGCRPTRPSTRPRARTSRGSRRRSRSAAWSTSSACPWAATTAGTC